MNMAGKHVQIIVEGDDNLCHTFLQSQYVIPLPTQRKAQTEIDVNFRAMTVSYNHRVTESGTLTFLRILGIWRGSMYKLLWKEMIIYVTLFYSLNMSYRYLLNEKHKQFFERVTLYCDAFIDLIPLSFVLGFFVSSVVSRWWSQYESIPWPDDAAISIGSMVMGSDDESRMIRRTLIRYLNLMSLLIFRCISKPVKMRFPELESLVDAGIMTQSELNKLQSVPLDHSKWWIPSVWYSLLLTETYKKGLLVEERSYKDLFERGLHLREECGRLMSYDWVNIPLVYTQVVTLATYTYFVTSLMGGQLLDPKKHITKHLEIYFPIFTFLQFFFYMGWFKVAEGLLNPFGGDQDDFDLNMIIDRNFKVSYLIVDDLTVEPPVPQKDMYWADSEPQLPYTVSSNKFYKHGWMGSAFYLPVGKDDMKIVKEKTSKFSILHSQADKKYKKVPVYQMSDIPGTSSKEQQKSST